MLSKDEIAAALKFLGVKASAKEVDLLCFSGDADKDGKIDFSEFVNDFVHFVFEEAVDETRQTLVTDIEIRAALAGDSRDEATDVAEEVGKDEASGGGKARP
jgi:hypothetical protein